MASVTARHVTFRDRPTAPRTSTAGTVPWVRIRTLAAVLGCATAVSLTACQSQAAVNREPHTGTSTAVDVAGVQQVVITTDSSYRFNPSTITVHPGRVQLILKHTGTGAPHDWQLQGFPSDYVPLTQAGQERSIEFTAPAPGRYQFVCTIHIAQGQTGTLVVLSQ